MITRNKYCTFRKNNMLLEMFEVLVLWFPTLILRVCQILMESVIDPQDV